MPNIRRWVGGVACATAVVMLGATSATAAAPSADPGSDVTVVSGSRLAALSTSAATRGTREAAARRYVAEQARLGRLVDLTTTKSAVVDDATVVWDAAIALDDVTIETAAVDAPTDAGVDQAVRVTSHQAPEARGSAVADLGTGAGLGAPSSYSGGTYLGGNCVSTTTTGGTATNCWQKYKIAQSTSTRDQFYYGRWATATATGGYTPTLIDLRSRPWAGSTAVASLADYWPRAGQKLCTSSGSIGFSSSGFSVTVPIQDCTEVSPAPNGTEMGVRYDQGAIFSGTSHGTEFGMVVNAFKGRVPSMADYTYVKFCYHTYASCAGNLRKDSGW